MSVLKGRCSDHVGISVVSASLRFRRVDFQKNKKWSRENQAMRSVLITYCAAHGCPYAPPLRGDAARAHERSAAPASSRHNASIARRCRDGRRSRASPSCRMTASCPGRRKARSRCGTSRAVTASGRCAGTRTQRGAGVPSNRASIARRRRDGRRSGASPSCRTATSCPDRGTTRSRSGACRAVSASGR